MPNKFLSTNRCSLFRMQSVRVDSSTTSRDRKCLNHAHAQSFDRCEFQSSVSWRWPKNTWALGTRMHWNALPFSLFQALGSWGRAKKNEGGLRLRATLMFRKFKVALNPTNRTFLKCWKLFRATLIPFVTFWKLIGGHVVAPRWLDDAKECIHSAWNN